MRSPAQPSCRAAGPEQAPNCGTSISLELQVQPVCGGPHAGINAQSGRRAGGRARLSIRWRSLAAEPLHRPPRSSLPSHELDSDPVRLWGACSADVVMSAYPRQQTSEAAPGMSAMCCHERTWPANTVPIARGPACHAPHRGRAMGARAYGNWRGVETLHNDGRGDSHLGTCAMTGAALSVMSFLFLGFFLGMRHATDTDHVVAIAAIVSRERSLGGSALIGAAWGVGHTITVMAVGAAIIVFGVVIPPQLGLSMDFAVGIMLVLLGVFTLTGMGRAVGAAHVHAGVPGGHTVDLHEHPHAHGDYVHRHPHGHGRGAHGHAEEDTPLARLDGSGLGRLALYEWLRPFAVGLVHGLAGSAAVALMVLSIIREP